VKVYREVSEKSINKNINKDECASDVKWIEVDG
jgi:hypothetical protein